MENVQNTLELADFVCAFRGPELQLYAHGGKGNCELCSNADAGASYQLWTRRVRKVAWLYWAAISFDDRLRAGNGYS
jgi:hypothetical protein